MSTDVKVPKLGVEMKSVIVDNWLIEDGGWVDENSTLLEIQTDKVTYEIESSSSGYVKRIGEEGQEYQIGEVLARIFETKEDLTSENAVQDPKPKREEITQKPLAEPVHSAAVLPNSGSRKVKASPLAKKIARDQQVNLTEVAGTGPGGAVIKDDVMSYIESLNNRSIEETAANVMEQQVQTERGDQAGKAIKKTSRLSPMRRTIAKRMEESLKTTAQMTDINEVNVTKIVEFRNELKALEAEIGYKVSYLDLFVKLIAVILKKMPVLNASIQEDEIVYWEDINIGIAVSVEDGLMVPVLHQADKLSLIEIHHRLQDLIRKAKANQLSKEEVTGGTFTITNIGSYGGYYGTPILNSPEVAIWGMGAIVQKPVIQNGEIAIGEMMGSSLTVDHRLIDGEVAGKFQNELKRLVENPKLLFLH